MGQDFAPYELQILGKERVRIEKMDKIHNIHILILK
jgi:hypothetical protein